MVSHQLYPRDSFTLEDVIDKLLQRRKIILAPHTLDLFNFLLEAMDHPAAMVSFYREYRELLMDKATKLGFVHQDRLAWLSQHHVGEDVFGRKYPII